MNTIRRINRSLLLALESEAEAAAAVVEVPADEVKVDAKETPPAETPPVETPVETPAEAPTEKTEEKPAAESGDAPTLTSDDMQTEVKAVAKVEVPESTPIVPASEAPAAPKAVTENMEATPTEEVKPVEVAVVEAPVETPAEPVVEKKEEKPAAETADVPPAEVQVEVPVEAPAEAAVVVAEPEEKPAVSAEDLAVIETDGEAAEADIEEAEEVAQATDEIGEEIETVEQAQTALEAIAEVMDIARQNGGLDRNGARLATISVNHIYQSIGVKRPLAVPAMESFDTVGARATATSIAMEDIKEQLKKIWEMIVAGVKQAAEWITQFVTKIFSANARLKSRAEKLVEATKSLEGNPKQTSVGSAAMAKALAMGSGASKNVATDLGKINQFTTEAAWKKTVQTMKDVESALEKEYDRVFDAAAKGTDQAGEFEGVRKLIQDIAGHGLKAYTGNPDDIGAPAAPEGTDLFASPVFLGNAAVWAHVPSTVDAISKFRSGVAMRETDVKDGATLVTLNAAQIKAVAEEVLAFVVLAEGYKDIQESVKSLTAWYAKKLSGVTQITNMTDGVRSYLNAIKGVRMLIKGIHQPAMQIAVKANSAALDYAAASLKAYNGKSEDAQLPQLEKA
jgi:phiKZ-like phage internal head proteins